MTWIILAIAVVFWLRGRAKHEAALKILAQVTSTKEQLAATPARAEAPRTAPTRRGVILPAPYPLVALAVTDCQAACALYSWICVRGEGRA